jgi:uncharacterized membrane protein HdeD (DUF308 family)
MAYQRQVPSSSLVAEWQRHRGWMIGLGVVLTILGVLAIAAAVFTTVLSMKVLGWMLIIGGIVQIVHAFSAPRWRGVVLSLLEGIVYGVVGVLIATRPLESAVVATLLLGGFLMISGLFRIVIVPTFLRARNWGWVMASGIISFLLGLTIWAQWPVSGAWVLGAFVGIEMIGWGISLIMLGVALRDVDAAEARRLEAA